MTDFFSRLKVLDAYPKLHEEVKVKTFSGAAVSVCALIFIIVLFISELTYYLSVEKVDHLFVDTSRGEKLQINFDVTFPRIPCSLLSVDAMDVSGSHQLDVSHHITKKSLDSSGNPLGVEVKQELGHSLKESDVTGLKDDHHTDPATGQAVKAEPPVDKTKLPGYCGSCYGAQEYEGQCCNTCDDVKTVYRKKGWAVSNLGTIEQCEHAGDSAQEYKAALERGEGCQMQGFLQVNRVAGNFHFAPGKSFQHAHMHIHDLAAFSSGEFNVSHRVNRLSFGADYPGIVNPLDGMAKHLAEGSGGGMFMYYAKVVPTNYHYLDGKVIDTNQFSVTEHFRTVKKTEGQGLPGVFIFYELSPIMVQFTETQKSLAHFLTQLCAILGGVFTVAGMIDRIVYGAIKQIEKKMQLNKLS
jgi:hypothetical protein